MENPNKIKPSPFIVVKNKIVAVSYNVYHSIINIVPKQQDPKQNL